MNRLILKLSLAACGIWAVSRNYCLIVNGPAVFGNELGQVAFGIALQALSVLAFGTSINREVGYFRIVWDWVASPKLQAALWALPFVFFLISHHIVAKGLYGEDEVDKIKIASGRTPEGDLMP